MAVVALIRAFLTFLVRILLYSCRQRAIPAAWPIGVLHLMSVNRILAFAVVGLSLGSSAMAAPIISGNGESWTSAVDAVCTQVGACFGVTVLVDGHPAWKDHTLTDPRAQWVSYADTGYGGSILAPRAGDASNPTGRDSDHGNRGDASPGLPAARYPCASGPTTRSRCSSTAQQMKAPVFGQDTCADAPIGCESGEYWDLNTTTTGGLDTLRLVAYQVGSGEDTTDNPFGVLYAGSYVGGGTVTPTSAPEPMTMSLMGAGLACLGARRWRQRRNG